jgi:tetratricopeptide (TPR) repeat protein
VSAVPQEIPDFGSVKVAPRQNPRFVPGGDFTSEDYYVWSRLDGRTSLHDIILMVGLGTDRVVSILRKLRRSGAVLLPGEEAPPVVVPAPPPEPQPSVEPPALSPEEERALAEPNDLSEADRRRILQFTRILASGDHFALFGVPRTADKRDLKRAYFRLSKEFHPDRYYNQNLGSFGPWLSRIFETASAAFELLSDDGRRAEYLRRLGGTGAPAPAGGAPAPAPAPAARPAGAQDRAAHAAELFERACVAEGAGEPEDALRLFAAVVKMEPQPRYLRRAARCAVAVGRLSEAEEYAKKAASLRSDDPSYARVLADVYRAAGRLEQAERILVKALELPTASDVMARELEADLAAVRSAAEKVKTP